MEISPTASGEVVLTLSVEERESLKQVCHFWNGNKEQNEDALLKPVNALSVILEERL